MKKLLLAFSLVFFIAGCSSVGHHCDHHCKHHCDHHCKHH